jgi:PAS domain S-box-containing protein
MKNNTNTIKRPQGILNRFPLTLKMTIVTLMVGLLVWVVLDYQHTRSLRDTLLKHFTYMLKQEAKENRRLFSDYLKGYRGAAKTIIITDSFNKHLDGLVKKGWSMEKDFEVIYHSETPRWLPSHSVLRSLVHIDYVFLLDEKQKVREVYLGSKKEFPPSLLKPENRLLRLSQGQSFLSSFNGDPFLVRSEPVVNARQEVIATLILVSALDTDFLMASQGHINPNNMLALVEGKDSRIVSSSHPHLFPPGTTLESLEDEYLIDKVNRVFFDLGASELRMQIASFISKDEYEPIARSILLKERSLRATGAVFLIFFFIILIFLVTSSIRRLTRRVVKFSRKTLGIQQSDEPGGDEIYTLDNSFQQMTREIESSHDSLKKQAESLRKERDRAQRYLDISGVMIVVITRDQRVALINKKGCEILGYDEEEIVGKNWFDNFIPARLRDQIKTVFERLIKGEIRPLEYFENPVLTKSGEERTIAWHNSVLKDDNDNIISTLGSGEDITERRIAEAEVMRASQLAALGEMSAGVAHEVNNPITGIINYAQILVNRSSPESREREIAAKIIKESERIAGIVKALLSFSHESKEGKLPVSINEIMSDTLSLIESQIRKDGIDIRTSIPKDLPAVFAQPQQIEQVFLNIISNARYALNQRYKTAHKNKILEIKGIMLKAGEKPFVRITFYDRGIGIPSHIKGKIMNPFFSTKADSKGTGLGLSISHGIINDHCGKLTVESTENEFTRVTIDLPAYINKKTETGEEKIKQGLDLNTGQSGKGPKIKT